MKAANDTDGKLFLCGRTGQLRSGDQYIPLAVHLIYLIPIQPGTKVEVFDQVTKKKKYQTITTKDSGWEITTPQSAPPTDASPPPTKMTAPVGDFVPGNAASTNTSPAEDHN